MAMVVDKSTCIGCEACIAICPVGAIEMKDGKADINKDICVSCGVCVSECPVEAISNEGNDLKVTNDEKNESENKDIWVLVELEEGKINSVSNELIEKGGELAKKIGQKVCAVIIGNNVKSQAEDAIHLGANKVYIVDNEIYKDYNTELFANAFCELNNEFKPNAVLIGATIDGRDLAPRIAARLKTGLCADCTSLDISEEKLVEWTRPALGGNILATILCDASYPQMGTVRPNVFKNAEKDLNRTGEIVSFEPNNKIISRTKLMKNEENTVTGFKKIEDAEIVCSGGRGMGSLDQFNKLDELARLFDGSVAGSRAVVDEGWINHSQQVGQSGKSITPKIYFAFGISGAIQHLSGMSSSDIIVAINKDPNAPIFKVAKYGIVGDVKEVLPILINKIKELKK